MQMTVNQITPEEAKQLLDGDDDYVYIDVRSEFEFEQAHPEGAYNIPIKQLNPELRMLQDNPDFLPVMQAIFPKDAKLVLGCASGPRSNTAGMLLAQSGFSNLNNVNGGFSGIKDMMGNLIQPGWQQLEYPVETGNGGERGYDELVKNLNNETTN